MSDTTRLCRCPDLLRRAWARHGKALSPALAMPVNVGADDAADRANGIASGLDIRVWPLGHVSRPVILSRGIKRPG
jgi:hypothetical protein